MGLFDVFSKGGKYFGKSIEPKCEYCEFGKRAKDGAKVLCERKGLVEASFHCPKFVYSPLKRIPLKQMQKVGWLEGDYDEKGEDVAESTTAKTETAAEQPHEAAPAAQPEAAPEATAAPAAPAATAQAANDLASLAAMADAAGDYAPSDAQPADNGVQLSQM